MKLRNFALMIALVLAMNSVLFANTSYPPDEQAVDVSTVDVQGNAQVQTQITQTDAVMPQSVHLESTYIHSPSVNRKPLQETDIYSEPDAGRLYKPNDENFVSKTHLRPRELL